MISMPIYLKNDSKRYSVDDNGCWNWLYALNGVGYGITWYKGKNKLAHRYFYEKYKKEIPKGLVLDHLCRNRLCVNPEHLEIVNHAENCRRGNQTKIKHNDILKIKLLNKEGKTQKIIGKLFNITQSQISRIINNKRWINV